MLRRQNALLALSLFVASTYLVGCGSERADERGTETEGVATTSEESEAADATGRDEVAVESIPPFGDYRCATPPVPIPRPRACERGRPYPLCKWNLPHALESRGSYRRWRNTIPEHRWGRPGLVSLLLASAAEYHERFDGQILSIGDLDAPGPRHQTHDRGVDVDIYLPGAMITENVGGGRYVENYEGRSEDEVEGLRQRVEELARILAVCSEGRLRIYYNDPVVVERFNGWFVEEGLESPFGEPMQLHNDLHRFHFHMTVADDLAPLPASPEPHAPDPIIPIPAPPSIAGVTRVETMEAEAEPAPPPEPEANLEIEVEAEPETETEAHRDPSAPAEPATPAEAGAVPEPGELLQREPRPAPAAEPEPGIVPSPAG